MSKPPIDAVAEVPSGSPYHAAPRRKSKLWYFLLPLLLGGLGLFAGLGGGILHFTMVKATYNVDAFIFIAPKISIASGESIESVESGVLSVDHCRLLPHIELITGCFSEHSNLSTLESFDDVPTGEIPSVVQRDLTVEPTNRENGKVFRVTYRSQYPDDAKLVLNSILDFYRASLEEKFPNPSDEEYYFTLLQTPSDGKQIWPSLPISTGVGGLAGMIAGALFGLVLAMLIVRLG